MGENEGGKFENKINTMKEEERLLSLNLHLTERRRY